MILKKTDGGIPELNLRGGFPEVLLESSRLKSWRKFRKNSCHCMALLMEGTPAMFNAEKILLEQSTKEFMMTKAFGRATGVFQGVSADFRGPVGVFTGSQMRFREIS